MAPPLLKPETQRALKEALQRLAPELDTALQLLGQRTQEHAKATEKLKDARAAVEALQAKGQALEDDLGVPPKALR